MSDRILIRLEGVYKRYGDDFVLRIDNLELREGDHFAIYGSNGSGKSTLLRLVAGVSRADGGQVHRTHLKSEAVGFVPQNGGLYAHLSVEDNLVLRRRLYGLGPACDRAQELVSKLGLQDLLERRVSDLSGGYRRLAAVAAALITEPRWLVLDEVFSGVDLKNRERICGALDELIGDLRLLVTASPEPQPGLEPNRALRLEHGEVV